MGWHRLLFWSTLRRDQEQLASGRMVCVPGGRTSPLTVVRISGNATRLFDLG